MKPVKRNLYWEMKPVSCRASVSSSEVGLTAAFVRPKVFVGLSRVLHRIDTRFQRLYAYVCEVCHTDKPVNSQIRPTQDGRQTESDFIWRSIRDITVTPTAMLVM